MPAKTKICGISTAVALDACIAARADYAGLVFFAKSPRNVAIADAAALAAQGKGRIAMVGLFVDSDDAALKDIMAAVPLDIVQLHGAENPARCAEIRRLTGRPVWKALSVASADDVARAAHYAGAADLVLFDAKTPRGADLPGGMGLRFDWGLLAGYHGPLPWGLAGGLEPGNVAAAIAQTGAPLVDTSSGVESAPGVKDVDKIAAFCKAVRD